jgi:hypothetical protein
VAAVDFAASENYGTMVSLTAGRIVPVRLSVVREGARRVDAGLCDVARLFFG